MSRSSKLFAAKIKSSNSGSLIARYYAGIREASAHLASGSAADGFAPEFSYPELNDTWEEYFDVARAGWSPLGSYRDRNLTLLDLMKNPNTRTTKTIASLLMVARAVRHINETGEAVLLFTPSSGNKAIALRDAVARALQFGLAAPDKLRVVTLTPSSTVYKFRRDSLTESDELRRLNPILVHPGPEAAAVKHIGKAFAEKATSRAERVWYSLDINNYKAADSCRAFYEHEFGEAGQGSRRLHAHAVSSAYGLLGYQHGLNTMAKLGITHPQPGFLLVQHLATSDMVRHYIRCGLGEPFEVNWKPGDDQKVYEQRDSAYFPRMTWDPEENLEPTFYTQNPPTAPEMTSLISAHGGSAIVVSLLECLHRYGTVRRYADTSGQSLPADPRRLAEWSLVMGLTGVLNSLDRGLIDDFDEVVLHGSGMYFAEPGQVPDRSQFTVVRSVEDVAQAVV